MTDWFQTLLLSSQDATIMAAGIGAITFLTKKHLPPPWVHALWMLVLIRLLLPALPFSPTSWQHWIMPSELWGGEDSARNPDYSPTGTLAYTTSARLEGEAHSTSAIAASEKSSFFLETAMMIWISGVLILLSIASAHLTRKLKRLRSEILHSPHDAGMFEAILDDIVAELGFKYKPRLCFTGAKTSPSLSNPLRPTLNLSPDSLRTLNRQEIRMILAHELGHLRRMDLWTNLAFSCLLVLHWFNPAIWWVYRQFRVASEEATDHWVLSKLGSSHSTAYNQTLLKLLHQFDNKPFNFSTVGVLEKRTNIERRVTTSLNFRGKTSLAGKALGACLVTIISATCLTQPLDSQAALELGYSQKLGIIQIDEVNLKGVPLESALNWIEATTQAKDPSPEINPIKFVIAREVDLTTPITLKMSNAPAAEVLRFMLSLAAAEIRVQLDGIHIVASEVDRRNRSWGQTPGGAVPGTPAYENRPSPGFQFYDHGPIYRTSNRVGRLLEHVFHDLQITDPNAQAAIDRLTRISQELDETGEGLSINFASNKVPKGALQIFECDVRDPLSEHKPNIKLLQRPIQARNIPMSSAISSIALRVNHKVTIENDQIILVPITDPKEQRKWVSWKVSKGLAESLDLQSREAWRAIGVSFETHSAIFYDATEERLHIQNSPDNLTLIESFLKGE